MLIVSFKLPQEVDEVLEWRISQLTSYFPHLACLGVLVVTGELHHILAKIRSEKR